MPNCDYIIEDYNIEYTHGDVRNFLCEVCMRSHKNCINESCEIIKALDRMSEKELSNLLKKCKGNLRNIWTILRKQSKINRKCEEEFNE